MKPCCRWISSLRGGLKRASSSIKSIFDLTHDRTEIELLPLEKKIEKYETFLHSKKAEKLNKMDKFILQSKYIRLLSEFNCSTNKNLADNKNNVYTPISEYGKKFYKKRPNTELKYIKIIDRLFNDIENLDFHTQSSVGSRHLVEFESKKRVDDYSKLSSFNLRYHTLGVFAQAYENIRTQPDDIVSKVIILALAHDFGKSSKIKEYMAISPTKLITHNQVSGMYVRRLFEEMGLFDDGQWFYEILTHHHKIKTEKATEDELKLQDKYQKNLFVKLLNEADRIQREKEINIYNEYEFVQRQKQEESKSQLNKPNISLNLYQKHDKKEEKEILNNLEFFSLEISGFDEAIIEERKQDK